MGDTSGIDEHTWGLLDTLEKLGLYNYNPFADYVSDDRKQIELLISPTTLKEFQRAFGE